MFSFKNERIIYTIELTWFISSPQSVDKSRSMFFYQLVWNSKYFCRMVKPLINGFSTDCCQGIQGLILMLKVKSTFGVTSTDCSLVSVITKCCYVRVKDIEEHQCGQQVRKEKVSQCSGNRTPQCECLGLLSTCSALRLCSRC